MHSLVVKGPLYLMTILSAAFPKRLVLLVNSISVCEISEDFFLKIKINAYGAIVFPTLPNNSEPRTPFRVHIKRLDLYPQTLPSDHLWLHTGGRMQFQLRLIGHVIHINYHRTPKCLRYRQPRIYHVDTNYLFYLSPWWRYVSVF